MAVVIIAEGFANGQYCPHAGQYLRSFDHEAHGGIGYASFTSDINKAKRFPNMGAAMAFWRKIPKNKPTREDGKPNRPFTALTVIIVNESCMVANQNGAARADTKHGLQQKT